MMSTRYAALGIDEAWPQVAFEWIARRSAGVSVATGACRVAWSVQAIDTCSDAECDDAYVGVRIPPHPPDLDCGDIPFKDVDVRRSGPHGFDREGDGVGCEGS